MLQLRTILTRNITKSRGCVIRSISSVLVQNVGAVSTCNYKASPCLTRHSEYDITVRTMASSRHKKMIKLSKGFRGRANRCYTVSKHRVMKARQYMYRDRKVKKRRMRTLWIQRLNASSNMYGLKYNAIIYGMRLSNIKLNRKVLADIAVTEPLSFRSVAEVVKQTFQEKKLLKFINT